MAKPSIQYKRLPGFGYLRAVRLWLGPDHVLFSEISGFAEEYKRFYYRDIQAVIMRRTSTALTVTAVLAVLIFCSTLLASFEGVGWWVIDALLVISLLINVLQGPTCKTYLKTAVQLEKLPCWGRVRRTERGIARLRERVLQAQGSMAPEEARSRLEEMINQPPAAAPTAENAQGLFNLNPINQPPLAAPTAEAPPEQPAQPAQPEPPPPESASTTE